MNEDMEADAYLPDYPELSGNNYLMKNIQKPNYISILLTHFICLVGMCDENDESQMTMKFKGFVITFNFQKTPGEIHSSQQISTYDEYLIRFDGKMERFSSVDEMICIKHEIIIL